MAQLTTYEELVVTIEETSHKIDDEYQIPMGSDEHLDMLVDAQKKFELINSFLVRLNNITERVANDSTILPTKEQLSIMKIFIRQLRMFRVAVMSKQDLYVGVKSLLKKLNDEVDYFEECIKDSLFRIDIAPKDNDINDLLAQN